jgi:hypothetical protein
VPARSHPARRKGASIAGMARTCGVSGLGSRNRAFRENGLIDHRPIPSMPIARPHAAFASRQETEHATKSSPLSRAATRRTSFRRARPLPLGPSE